MTLESVTIPKQAGARKVRFEPKLVEEAATRVMAGEVISDGVRYEERTAAQVAAWHLRQAIADHLGVNAKDALRSRTWVDSDGFKYGVFARVQDKQPEPKPASKK
jgi:hypothetical protein